MDNVLSGEDALSLFQLNVSIYTIYIHIVTAFTDFLWFLGRSDFNQEEKELNYCLTTDDGPNVKQKCWLG